MHLKPILYNIVEQANSISKCKAILSANTCYTCQQHYFPNNCRWSLYFDVGSSCFCSLFLYCWLSYCVLKIFKGKTFMLFYIFIKRHNFFSFFFLIEREREGLLFKIKTTSEPYKLQNIHLTFGFYFILFFFFFCS